MMAFWLVEALTPSTRVLPPPRPRALSSRRRVIWNMRVLALHEMAFRAMLRPMALVVAAVVVVQAEAEAALHARRGRGNRIRVAVDKGSLFGENDQLGHLATVRLRDVFADLGVLRHCNTPQEHANHVGLAKNDAYTTTHLIINYM